MSSGPDLEVPVHGRLLHVMKSRKMWKYNIIQSETCCARQKSSATSMHDIASCMDPSYLDFYLKRLDMNVGVNNSYRLCIIQYPGFSHG